MSAARISQSIDNIRELIRRLARPVRIMEVCGTHTVAVCRSGLRSLLPADLSLISGPGCPVCVTPVGYIDQAIAIARQPGTLVATFGDLMRVPGSSGSLEEARARGADIRIVYSPSDALDLARRYPRRKVVFLGVGFETTAPAIAWTISFAAGENIRNFTVLTAIKTMPGAMAALVEGDHGIDGFICPGHVSSIIGTRAYEFIARRHHRPCVIAGFEPLDIVRALEMLLAQIAARTFAVENQYRRAVNRGGNEKAIELIKRVFAPCDATWRGLGTIKGSGLKLRAQYRGHDAACCFPGTQSRAGRMDSRCRCGAVLRGIIVPPQCPMFARGCTPEIPRGACMVSSEGTCAAYYRYCRTGRGRIYE